MFLLDQFLYIRTGQRIARTADPFVNSFVLFSQFNFVSKFFHALIQLAHILFQLAVFFLVKADKAQIALLIIEQKRENQYDCGKRNIHIGHIKNGKIN